MTPTIPNGIAVIGMAGRFPGAPDLDRFWENLRDGVESVTFFSEEELRAAGIPGAAFDQPGYVRARPVLDGVERFDAAFFGYTPREAALMDPQHRLFLEGAWAALEDAGYAPGEEGRDGHRIGVFAGAAENTYLLYHILPRRDLVEALGGLQLTISSSKDYLCTRVSYKLNLRGPSLTVQTACSTSLVTVHLACQSLLNHECDMALAGAVAVRVPQTAGYLYQEGGLWSPDGHCRAFDARALGTVFGSGLGLVVLKRLEDALADGDTVRAVIRGSAINNDGAAKVGYTAPSVDGQAEVIAEALGVAGVEPDTVGYVEAHGTGTPLGDPIEIAALTQAFRERTDATGFCAIGSVKTNIGHLDTAAGMAGLLKAVLALERRQIPPSLHFEANPGLGLSDTPFFVNTRLAEWPETGAPPRAGVSSFGVGGTNAHVVLEAAPPPEASSPSWRRAQLLVLSAATRPALERATRRLRDHLERHPEQPLDDVAFTLHAGRRAFAERRALVCRDWAEALEILGSPGDDRVLEATAPGSAPPVVFLFPGQGSQYVGMARELYEVAAVFREVLDRCAELLRPHLGLDLRTVLFPAPGGEAQVGALERTELAQPALFAVEYALARLWMSWGVKPAGLIGHSVGEYAAACLAGVFSLEEALALVAARGRLVQPLPAGAMLAVELPAAEVVPWLGEELALAAVNGPRWCVVAGPEPAVAALEDNLAARGTGCRRLHTRHAFHSPMLEPVLPAFRELCGRVRLQPPALPLVSNVTGTWLTTAEATDPEYWARQLRATVRFEEGVRTVLEGQPPGILPVFLEVGPGHALSTFVRQQGRGLLAVPSVRHPQAEISDGAFLLAALGRLWLAGVPFDVPAFFAGERRRRVPLPAYPFEPQRHWVEAVVLDGGAPLPGMGAAAPRDEALSQPAAVATAAAPPKEVEQIVVDTWRELLGVEDVRPQDDFFELGGHSLLATRLLARLGERCGVQPSIGDLFAAPTVAGMVRALEALRDHPAGMAGTASGMDLATEGVLDPAITSSGLPAWEPGEPEAVLLTGATGFLGAYLLHELLQQTGVPVVCLVRAGSDTEAGQRLRRKLEEEGLWDPAASGRIVPVAGDLALPRLGLEPARFEELAGSVAAIYHNGSWVNWLYPYPLLKPANVLGTQELLRLAGTVRLKPLHYVSSVAVFDSHAYEANELCRERPAAADGTSFTTGYAAAKWVSERLLAQAGQRGIPAYVYRPSYVIGHSRTGACNLSDFLLRMVKGCLELRAAPRLDVLVNMAPVDYVSRALIHLSRQVEPPGTIFHLTNPVDARWLEIVAWMQRRGYELPLVPYGDWQAVLASQSGQDNALGPLRLLFPAAESHSVMSSDQPQGRRYDCRETLRRLARTSITCPPVGNAQLEICFDYLVRSGYLEPPRR